MYSALYTGMSGLTAFSKGLDAISNNVANLNTMGYKGNEIMFADLFYGYQMGNDDYSQTFRQYGSGVEAEKTSINFKQGDLRNTDNDTDVSIDGIGFFILRDDETTYYTRNGQFEFDQDGYLVSKNDGYRVAAFTKSGELVDLSIRGQRTSPPVATSEIIFTNNLSTGTARHIVEDVEIVDKAGETRKFTVTFVNNGSVTPRSWIVEVEDDKGKSIAKSGEIRFQGNGSPMEDFNSYSFVYKPSESDEFEITLKFGEPNTFIDSTSFAGGSNSDLKVASIDGNGPGSLVEINFTRDGAFETKYSNDESITGAKLALARFDNLQALKQIGGGLYSNNTTQRVYISTASNKGLGEIKGSSIELSNIELTDQFTNLIIVQRGYQAASQIITTANEMMQQLMDMGSRR